MAVYTVNLIIYTGTDFDQSFILANEYGNDVLNLNGYTLLSTMKKHSQSSTSINLNPAIVNIATGKIKVSLSSSQTLNLKPGRYYYDIVLIKNGVRDRVVEGEVFVKKAVTR